MRNILLTLALFAALAAQAVELDYNVNYKWGFINKYAGSGHISYQSDGDSFSATLNGHSIPWGSRVYCVSDTINGKISQLGANRFSQQTTYENGWYTKPYTTDMFSDMFANPRNYRSIAGGGLLNASSQTMEAITITADMLAIFRLAEIIDFPSMGDGERIVVPISMPDGTQKRVLIVYNGLGTDPISGAETYCITFNYSYDGSMSQYPVNCFIGKTNRLPLTFSADIAIGHVEMTLA